MSPRHQWCQRGPTDTVREPEAFLGLSWNHNPCREGPISSSVGVTLARTSCHKTPEISPIHWCLKVRWDDNRQSAEETLRFTVMKFDWRSLDQQMSLWRAKPDPDPGPTHLFTAFPFVFSQRWIISVSFQLVSSADVSQPSALFDPPSWLIFGCLIPLLRGNRAVWEDVKKDKWVDFNSQQAGWINASCCIKRMNSAKKV